MNFVSFGFWQLLLCLVVPYGLLRAGAPPSWPWERLDRGFVLLLGIILFATESPLSFGLFLAVATLVFAGMRVLPAAGGVRWPLVGILSVLALLPLLYFKYRDFIGFSGEETVGQLIPIGISFYTFQLIGILVDQARDPRRPVGLVDFLNFASFFPQIVAGPIERRDALLPQLAAFRFQMSAERLAAGLRYVVLGFFYKLVIADNIAVVSAWILKPTVHPWLIHFGNLVFGIRIYFDFCGYSLIALGLGKCLGVELTVNFLSPYTRRNIRKFWQTWHITLSNWFRDYIYVPMGGRGSVTAILAVFLVSGIWHGAGWNFVLWGACHGLLVAGFALVGSRFRLPAPVAWGLTTATVLTTWLFFYQTDTAILFGKLAVLLRFGDYLSLPVGDAVKLVGSYGESAYLGMGVLGGIVVIALEAFSLRRSPSPYAWAMRPWVQGFLILLIVWLAPLGNNGFIYFNF